MAIDSKVLTQRIVDLAYQAQQSGVDLASRNEVSVFVWKIVDQMPVDTSMDQFHGMVDLIMSVADISSENDVELKDAVSEEADEFAKVKPTASEIDMIVMQVIRSNLDPSKLSDIEVYMQRTGGEKYPEFRKRLAQLVHNMYLENKRRYDMFSEKLNMAREISSNTPCLKAGACS